MRFSKIAALVTVTATAFSLGACSSGGSGSSASGGAGDNSPVRVWFMQSSIPEAAQHYLVSEFEKENPGKKLQVEIQQWDGIVSKLQTSLASKNESPDLVEIGNTQTALFTSIGAFADITDQVQKLGGDKLIPSFVKAATVDGKTYALPLYAGARGIYYRKDLFEKAGIAVPKTIDEFTNDVIKLQKDNPDKTPGFSGMYLAATDIHGVESYLFAQGFDYAKKEGGKWVGQVTTPASIKALKEAQKIFKEGTTFGQDSQASQKSFHRYFNNGQTGVLIGTGNVGVNIDKSLWDAGKVGVFPIPSETPGTPGATFAGGSSIALAQNSKHPELAKKALKIIFSQKFQTLLAEDGWVPGNTEYGKDIKGPFGAISTTVIENSKLTPNTPQWGVNFDTNRLVEFYTRIAKGEDVEATAKAFNDELNTKLNSSK